MSDVRTAPDAVPPDAAPAGRPVRRRGAAPRRSRTTRRSRSRSAVWSSAARWTRRATASASWSRYISAARHASPISICGTPSDADEAVQDAFLKVFSHIGSYREAWPFEVWFTRILINGCLDRRKARGRRDRWFVGARSRRAADEARASAAAAPRRPRASPALARAPRQAGRRDRSPRRPAADGLHAVPLRRLHAAGSQRDDRTERVHRSCAPVSCRAQAARLAGRTAVIRPRASPPGRTSLRLVSGRAGRRAARPAGRRTSRRLRALRRAATRSWPRSWTALRARRRRRSRRESSRPSGCGSSSSRSCAGIALVGRPARVLSFPGRLVRRTIDGSARAHRAALARRGGRGRPVRRRRGRRVVSVAGAVAEPRSFLSEASRTRAQRLSPVATRGSGAVRCRGRRCVPVRPGDRAGASAHPRASGVRRPHAACPRSERPELGLADLPRKKLSPLNSCGDHVVIPEVTAFSEVYV